MVQIVLKKKISTQDMLDLIRLQNASDAEDAIAMAVAFTLDALRERR